MAHDSIVVRWCSMKRRPLHLMKGKENGRHLIEFPQRSRMSCKIPRNILLMSQDFLRTIFLCNEINLVHCCWLWQRLFSAAASYASFFGSIVKEKFIKKGFLMKIQQSEPETTFWLESPTSRALRQALLVLVSKDIWDNEEILFQGNGNKKINSHNLWASNRFSSPVNCGSLKTVRAFRRRQCLSALIPIPMPSISGTWQPLPGKPEKSPERERFPLNTILCATILIKLKKIINFKLLGTWKLIELTFKTDEMKKKV